MLQRDEDLALRVETLEQRLDNVEAALLKALSGTQRLSAVLKCVVKEGVKD
ncbi:MAG: hypothetical protein IJ667_02980 [Synergistaceae bacterium]|nr:hypothetical protein [Synergistaceae bacterium]